VQQAKGYADCTRFHVQYVFATNGHRYAEFDRGTQTPAGPFPLPDFPTHDALTARYATDTGIDITAPGSALLFMADAAAFNKPRYYQDAAIRAAFEKVLSCEKAGAPARILLSLATGAGKTVIAANLLCVKPAGSPSRRSSCDRDELRAQAWNKLSLAFPKGSVRIVTTEKAQRARNAKVHRHLPDPRPRRER
jgi:type I restriction enzyme R subunit